MLLGMTQYAPDKNKRERETMEEGGFPASTAPLPPISHNNIPRAPEACHISRQVKVAPIDLLC